jgi:hypothetical protein
MKTHYDEDFVRWTEETADAPRSGRFEGLDWEQIAEEIEGLGISERRALEGRLTVLLIHLLKWQCQPSRRCRSCSATIQTQRLQIAKLLKRMPSLKRDIEEDLLENYPIARIAASGETDLPESAFPPE